MENLSILQTIIQEAATFGWIDWLVTVTALIYVVLAARNNVWCWFWGIISCSFWAYASFMFYDLWLDALLQVFYVVMGFIGIYQWKYSTERKEGLTIQTMTGLHHIPIISLGLVLSYLFGYFFATYTAAAATYLDAFTTVFSVISTFLLVKKILENWLYWVVIDIVYLYLYASRGAYLFSLIMVIYVIVAVQGYFTWKKTMSTPQLNKTF